MAILLTLSGLTFLLIGGEALLRGAVALGDRFEMPPLLVGILIVGFGTSMPELVVSVRAVIEGAPGLAVGNVIGSNISNTLLILGCTAMFTPIARSARVLVPDGIVLILISIGVVVLGLRGNISALQGLLYLSLLAGLLTVEFVRARREKRLQKVLTEPVPFPAEIPQRLLVSCLLVVTGIAGLIYGADMLVAGATSVAQLIGVSPGLVGLTIVAVGTSLPELASSLVAAWRGHTTVAYGNVIGSNLFNLLGILGAAALAGPLSFPYIMVWLDGPAMVAATILMVLFVSSGSGLVRWEGVSLVALYFAYVAFRYIYALA